MIIDRIIDILILERGIVLKIELSQYEVEKFIRDYGIDTYDDCPCGSGKTFKRCCFENSIKINNYSEIKKLYHDLKIEIWNRRRWKKQICHWKGCLNETQNCHSIQNNRYLNQISNNKKEVYHFIPNGSLENEIIDLKEETVKFASTFNGFCNTHDRDLFINIESNNPIIYSIEQLYAFVYRNFYYMLCKNEVTSQIIIRKSLRCNAKYYKKDYIPKSPYYSQWAIELILNLRKHEAEIEEMKSLVSEIELNYDLSSISWRIINPILIFSNVRSIKVNNANFCFQTARKYIIKDSLDQSNGTIYDFKIKNFDYISTIILPDVAKSSITIFFTITTKHKSGKLLDFIDYVNRCSDSELMDILNNIILDGYEELYISKDKFYNDLTTKQQDMMKNVLTNNMFNYPIFYEDLFLKPKFEFLSLSN